MGNTSKKNTIKIIKQNAKMEAYNKLAIAFEEYKKDKKFDRKLQKAAKLIVPLIVKAKSEIFNNKS